MEIEIVSTEYIKPSSPTPLHLKTYKICLLDQSAAPIYIPFVFYYLNPINQKDKLHLSDNNFSAHDNLQNLKQSLSEALTLFYPFAGKVKDNLSIDCNDEGVHFTLAQVKNNVSLKTFLTKPDLSMITKFLPGGSTFQVIISTPGSHLLMIQVTIFSCGGVAVGVRLSHMITDAIGLVTFLKTWATIAKTQKANAQEEGEEQGVVLRPDFDVASSLFPQTDSFPSEATDIALATPFVKRGKCAITRLVFDASALATLKAKVETSSSGRVPKPTSVEVLTALLFKSMMRVIKEKNYTPEYCFKPIIMCHRVNLRPKVVPRLTEYSIGNMVWNLVALCEDEEPELHDLVRKLRETIAKVDKDFAKSLQGDGGLLKLCEAINDVRGVCTDAAERVGFSSMRYFGLYDVDFGWGKPIWVNCDGSSDKEDALFLYCCAFMDTRSGEGIEAWVYMDEQEIALLHNDKELTALSKVDPSPLG